MKPEVPKGLLMTTTSTKQGAFKDTRNEVKPRPRTFLRIPNFAPGISYIQKIGNPQLLDAKVEPASLRKYRFHLVCCLKLYSCSGVPMKTKTWPLMFGVRHPSNMNDSDVSPIPMSFSVVHLTLHQTRCP